MNKVSNNFLETLPDDVVNRTGLDNAHNNAYSFLEKRLPKNDYEEIKEKLKKRFPLSKEKQRFQKRFRHHGCPRNSRLSNTKKRALGLYNITKKGFLYKDLEPLNKMWNSYIEDYLDLNYLQSTGWNCDEATVNYEEISQLLWKADYHGAYITVSKSVCPNLVGISGILLFETKNTLRLLGKDDIVRLVPKSSCEFSLRIGNYDMKFLGKNFLVRSAERSSKKIREKKVNEL